MSAAWQDLLAEISLQPLSHQTPEIFVCPLTEHGVTQLSGEQSESYLQGQLTNDVTNLADNDYVMSAHCDAKGKMWSICQVLRRADSYYLISAIEENQATLKELQKYGVFAKTDIIDASNEQLLFAVGGSNAKAFIEQQNLNAINLKGSLAGNFLLMLNTDEAAQLISAAKDNLYHPVQWHKTKIEAGVASLDQHSINQFVPQMLNLQALAAISFSKGCYTGQEMVARMKYLGKNKRAAYIVKGSASQLPTSGDELQLAIGDNWRRGGQLINVAANEDGFYALAVLANDLEDDSQLRIKDDQNSQVTIQALPYSLAVEDQ